MFLNYFIFNFLKILRILIYIIKLIIKKILFNNYKLWIIKKIKIYINIKYIFLENIYIIRIYNNPSSLSSPMFVLFFVHYFLRNNIINWKMFFFNYFILLFKKFIFLSSFSHLIFYIKITKLILFRSFLMFLLGAIKRISKGYMVFNLLLGLIVLLRR